MILRFKKIISLIIIGVILSTSSIYTKATPIINSTSSEEIVKFPSRLLRIIQGSDEIYGRGVPIQHFMYGENSLENEISGYFISGGVDHTHQYIISSALYILFNDHGSSILNKEDYSALLLEYTDWPDVAGHETDYFTYSGHFYNPVTGKNWLGKTSPTAKQRALDYFEQAVKAYKAGDIKGAMRALGKGTHYVSDINEPHHASNLTAINSNHTDFETYVDNNRSKYRVNGHTLGDSKYQDTKNTSINTLLQGAALKAYNLKEDAQNVRLYEQTAEACVENAIICATKYIYHFGIEVGIYK